jgi:hypothetical protein
MVTDRQVRKLRKLVSTGYTLERGAVKAAIGESGVENKDRSAAEADPVDPMRQTDSVQLHQRMLGVPHHRAHPCKTPKPALASADQQRLGSRDGCGEHPLQMLGVALAHPPAQKLHRDPPATHTALAPYQVTIGLGASHRATGQWKSTGSLRACADSAGSAPAQSRFVGGSDTCNSCYADADSPPARRQGSGSTGPASAIGPTIQWGYSLSRKCRV